MQSLTPVITPSETDKVKLQTLIKNVESHRQKLESCDHIQNRQEFFKLMYSFWSFLSLVEDQYLCELFYHTEYFSKYKPQFQDFENYFTRTIEADESVAILTSGKSMNPSSFVDTFLEKRTLKTYELAKQEASLITKENPKKLVMVGCGAFPETLLSFHDNTDIPELVGLGLNQDSILANYIITNKNVDRIGFSHETPKNYDYSEADIVHIAGCYSNKKEIFDQIAKTAKIGTQVLVREPILMGKLMYEDITSINPRLRIIKRPQKDLFFLFESILLEKLDV